ALLRRLVDLIVGRHLRHPLLGLDRRDRRRQRRLPMIHMPNRPHVHMRLRPLKFRLGHGSLLVTGCWLLDSRRSLVAGRWSLVVTSDQRPATSDHTPYELAIGIEPMTSPLPRVCSTN